MKKLAVLLLAAFLAAPLLVAQNQNKEKKVQKTEHSKTHKHNSSEMDDKSKDGNAYGKNKENLEGKDFGQSRKQEAQMSKSKNTSDKQVKAKSANKQKAVKSKPEKVKSVEKADKVKKQEDAEND